MRIPTGKAMLLSAALPCIAACAAQPATEPNDAPVESTAPSAYSGLAATPPLGYNTWNGMEENVSDAAVLEVAQAMIKSGLRDAGYTYIIMDDHWAESERDPETKRFVPDRKRFPRGMKPLVDDLHALGFKVGVYSSAAERTCAQTMPGGYGFETIDAETFAEWGIDYFKYDYCGAPDTVDDAIKRYKAMGDALKATGRPIVYSICEWGQREPWKWGRQVGGHLWRTTYDMRDHWEFSPDVKREQFAIGVLDAIDLQADLAEFNGPGGWNDPDMTVIGIDLEGSSSLQGATGLNEIEEQTMMSFWALWSSPIIHNADLRKLDPEHSLYDEEWTNRILPIIGNVDVLAVNQDPAGDQAYRHSLENGIGVWRKTLANGVEVIGILNRNDDSAAYGVNIKEFAGGESGCAIDLWSGERLQQDGETAEITLQPHETRMLSMTCDDQS